MKKNLYSLTLSDEVVREVDALAHRLGTNRSALVNRILSALGGTIACSLYDGRFVRPLAMPRGHARSAEDIAGAISAYVQLFDRLLKGYLSGDLSAKDVELAYRGDLRGRGLLI